MTGTQSERPITSLTDVRERAREMHAAGVDRAQILEAVLAAGARMWRRAAVEVEIDRATDPEIDRSETIREQLTAESHERTMRARGRKAEAATSAGYLTAKVTYRWCRKCEGPLSLYTTNRSAAVCESCGGDC
jgi:hypothetical protein